MLYQSEQPTYEDSEPVLARGVPVKKALGIDPALFEEMLAETV